MALADQPEASAGGSTLPTGANKRDSSARESDAPRPIPARLQRSKRRRLLIISLSYLRRVAVVRLGGSTSCTNSILIGREDSAHSIAGKPSFDCVQLCDPALAVTNPAIGCPSLRGTPTLPGHRFRQAQRGSGGGP